ncbi:hypothetical protein EON66_08515 [archaeon]|nr:MAG: hypothetical protein EON66_08515 [archaeon]
MSAHAISHRPHSSVNYDASSNPLVAALLKPHTLSDLRILPIGWPALDFTSAESDEPTEIHDAREGALNTLHHVLDRIKKQHSSSIFMRRYLQISPAYARYPDAVSQKHSLGSIIEKLSAQLPMPRASLKDKKKMLRPPVLDPYVPPPHQCAPTLARARARCKRHSLCTLLRALSLLLLLLLFDCV